MGELGSDARRQRREARTAEVDPEPAGLEDGVYGLEELDLVLRDVDEEEGGDGVVARVLAMLAVALDGLCELEEVAVDHAHARGVRGGGIREGVGEADGEEAVGGVGLEGPVCEEGVEGVRERGGCVCCVGEVAVGEDGAVVELGGIDVEVCVSASVSVRE